MKVIKTERANTVYTAPEGVDDCGNLPVERWKVTNEYLSNESTWELSGDEIKRLQRSRRIYLNVFGEAHPPVALSVESLAETGERRCKYSFCENETSMNYQEDICCKECVLLEVCHDRCEDEDGFCAKGEYR